MLPLLLFACLPSARANYFYELVRLFLSSSAYGVLKDHGPCYITCLKGIPLYFNRYLVSLKLWKYIVLFSTTLLDLSISAFQWRLLMELKVALGTKGFWSFCWLKMTKIPNSLRWRMNWTNKLDAFNVWIENQTFSFFHQHIPNPWQKKKLKTF